MTRMISAIYEDGAFRPTEPIADLPEHTPVRLTVEQGAVAPAGKRVLGQHRGVVLDIAPDFDAEWGDEFWMGDGEHSRGRRTVLAQVAACLMR